ncbi:MAG: DUF2442 domain-containing protein, partial [Acidobacteria bacterium]
PAQALYRIESAVDEALSKIQVSPSGSGVSWPDLDADFSVPSLMAGIFGTREWMQKLHLQKGSPAQKN